MALTAAGAGSADVGAALTAAALVRRPTPRASFAAATTTAADVVTGATAAAPALAEATAPALADGVASAAATAAAAPAAVIVEGASQTVTAAPVAAEVATESAPAISEAATVAASAAAVAAAGTLDSVAPATQAAGRAARPAGGALDNSGAAGVAGRVAGSGPGASPKVVVAGADTLKTGGAETVTKVAKASPVRGAETATKVAKGFAASGGAETATKVAKSVAASGGAETVGAGVEALSGGAGADALAKVGAGVEALSESGTMVLSKLAPLAEPALGAAARAAAGLAAAVVGTAETDLSCASSNAPCPTLWGLTRGLESSVAPFLELEAGANLSLSLSVVTAGTSSPSTTAVALRSDCLDFALVHVGCVVDDGACESATAAASAAPSSLRAFAFAGADATACAFVTDARATAALSHSVVVPGDNATLVADALRGFGALPCSRYANATTMALEPPRHPRSRPRRGPRVRLPLTLGNFLGAAGASPTLRVEVLTASAPSVSIVGGEDQAATSSAAGIRARSAAEGATDAPSRDVPSCRRGRADHGRGLAFALARVASGPNRHVSASATVAFVANRAPTSGGVDVDPVDGEAARTIFGLTAASWVDDDYPLAYTFFSEVAGAENSLIYDALEPSFDAILPVGDAGNGHALVVGVSVKDARQAVARATTVARVRPATFSTDPTADDSIYTESTALLEDLEATGDVEGTFAAIFALASMLDAAAAADLTAAPTAAPTARCAPADDGRAVGRAPVTKGALKQQAGLLSTLSAAAGMDADSDARTSQIALQVALGSAEVGLDAGTGDALVTALSSLLGGAAASRAGRRRLGNATAVPRSGALANVSAAILELGKATLVDSVVGQEAKELTGDKPGRVREIGDTATAKLSPPGSPGALRLAAAGGAALDATVAELFVNARTGEALASTVLAANVRRDLTPPGGGSRRGSGRTGPSRCSSSSRRSRTRRGRGRSAARPASSPATGRAPRPPLPGGAENATLACGDEPASYELNCSAARRPRASAPAGASRGRGAPACAVAGVADDGAVVCACAVDRTRRASEHAATTDEVYATYYRELLAEEGLSDRVVARNGLLATLAGAAAFCALLGAWAPPPTRGPARRSATRTGGRRRSSRSSRPTTPRDETHAELVAASLPRFMRELATPRRFVWDALLRHHGLLNVLTWHPSRSRPSRAFELVDALAEQPADAQLRRLRAALEARWALHPERAHWRLPFAERAFRILKTAARDAVDAAGAVDAAAGDESHDVVCAIVYHVRRFEFLDRRERRVLERSVGGYDRRRSSTPASRGKSASPAPAPSSASPAASPGSSSSSASRATRTPLYVDIAIEEACNVVLMAAASRLQGALDRAAFSRHLSTVVLAVLLLGLFLVLGLLFAASRAAYALRRRLDPGRRARRALRRDERSKRHFSLAFEGFRDAGVQRRGPAAFWPDDDDDVSVVLEK
ncbi:hypothetical protein JL720_9864 [Aureococcus anophagefferens]|nr:hypothetical protein JL720_9864 [Aureococcus anophagefferens]